MKFKLRNITVTFLSMLLLLNPLFHGDIFSFMSFAFLIIYMLCLNFAWPKIPDLGLLFLLTIFLLGFGAGVLNGFNKNYLRDVWIFFKPMYVILFGALLASHYVDSDRKVFRLIVATGVVSAVYHFIEILRVPNFQRLPLHSIRELTRRASLIEALALSLILYAIFKSKVKIYSKRVLYLCGVIILTSVILFVSRNMFLILFIFIAFLFSYFKFSMKALGVGLVLFALLGFVFSMPKQSEQGTFGRLINKIQKAPKELFFSSEEQSDKKSINENWRGYEAFRAITQTIQKGTKAVLIGNGFGSLVDLKIVMRLGNSEFRFVPKIHNGYAQLFFKTGLVSVILYGLYLFVFYKRVYKIRVEDEDMRVLKKITLGSIVTLLLTTSTIAGIYNDSSLDSILLLMVFSFVRLKKYAAESYEAV